MPIPLVAPALTGSGATLQEYVYALARELGFAARCTVSSTLATGEAARTIVVNELRDDEWDEAARGDFWVYVLTGDQAGAQRRVISRGYHGNQGALTLSRPFAAPLEADDLILLTWPLPVKEYIGGKGIITLVNDALNRIRVEGRIFLEGDGTTSTDLSDYSFLRDVLQTTGTYDRTDGTLSTDAATPAASGYSFTVNGPAVSLVNDVAYTSGTEFELGVIVNADRLINDGSGWGYVDAPGLVNDTDQAAAPLEWVRTFGMVKALEWWEIQIEQDEGLSDARRAILMNQIARRKPKYSVTAARIQRDEFPVPHAPRRRPLMPGLVSNSWTTL